MFSPHAWSDADLRNDIRELRNQLERLRQDATGAYQPSRTEPQDTCAAVEAQTPGDGQPAQGLGSIPRGRIIASQQPSVALVIATFAGLPYIHLGLESWRRNYPDVPVLVHDDGSPLAAELEELCNRYGVDFSCNAQRLRHTVGDLSAFLRALDWATEKGIEVLVKMSRRFVPLGNWVPELQRLAWESQYATYSQRCRWVNFGFRTECIALHVPSWRNSPGYDDMRERVRHGEAMFVEGYMHGLALQIHKSACDVNKHYEQLHPRPAEADGYGAWDLMPDSRATRAPDVLWHDCDSPTDYARTALLFGLPYRTQDFEDPNYGAGSAHP
jgi:hypothetical protein